MAYKVLASDWYSPSVMGISGVIGVVAIASGPNEENWKAYIGIALGMDERGDEQYIAANGSKVSKEVACAYFPNLLPEGFIY